MAPRADDIPNWEEAQGRRNACEVHSMQPANSSNLQAASSGPSVGPTQYRRSAELLLWYADAHVPST